MVSLNILFYFILFYRSKTSYKTFTKFCVIEHLSSTNIMTKTMTGLNRTNQQQLIAKKNKVVSITIQASNNKVKNKMKRVVPKNKKAGQIKDKLKVIHH